MSRVAGIVPAAGLSERMGRPKALLEAGSGRTFLEQVVATLARGGCHPVVVAIREGAGAEARLARRVGARLVVNPDPAEGPISSVRAALRSLPSSVRGVAVLPVDHPMLEAATVEALLAELDAGDAPVVVPVHDGRRGHPVVLARTLFPELLEDALPEGIRTVLRRDPTRVREVAVDDPGVLADLDTPEAYRRHLPEAAGRSLGG